jgi:lauroyl/myristoyl acyltransferase
VLEEAVRENPKEWFWMHNRWKMPAEWRHQQALKAAAKEEADLS